MELIQELTRLQHIYGYLREADLHELSERQRVPLYRIEEVVSFYPHFRTIPPPKVQIAVCRDLTCALNGGKDFCDRARELIGDGGDVELQEVSCIGRCDIAPAALVNGVPVGGLTPGRLAELGHAPADLEPPVYEARSWRIDPYDGDAARYSIYEGLRARPRPRPRPTGEAASEIIEKLKAAGLRGMGGAGFPTGRKWELVRAQKAEPKYVVCNADESEPGTIKDRAILGQLSHLMLEGMCLAGLSIGAERGWIYLRHEYEPERQAVQAAIESARERGVLGAHFDVEIFISPGGYILGEETALLEALESKRGEPRNKPPYPGERGLWSKPTLINNVETLAMIPIILAKGAAWWKEQGLRGHSGLKVISVSGHVERPGNYEIPMGTTMAELIELAGGVSDGRALKAFAPGGASSDFLPASAVDVEIDFDSIAEAGSMLGSGALVVLAEGTDMIEAATNVTRFFRNESCGKCVPCRVGTEKVVGLLEDILAGKGDGRLRELLPELSRTLGETSICGLGQVALNPIVSVLENWGDELDAYLEGSS